MNTARTTKRMASRINPAPSSRSYQIEVPPHVRRRSLALVMGYN